MVVAVEIALLLLLIGRIEIIVVVQLLLPSGDDGRLMIHRQGHSKLRYRDVRMNVPRPGFSRLNGQFLGCIQRRRGRSSSSFFISRHSFVVVVVPMM